MDLARIRSQFPALDRGVAHFDGPGGSQVPTRVAEAVARTMTAGLANRGTVTDAERRAEDVVVGARTAVADLLGADPRGVVFGRSMTQLTFDLARTISRGWRPGDEVVVTRLDHDANIRPWVLAAEAAGATVRWLDFDPETAELDDLDPSCRPAPAWSRSPAASNLLGTRPDVPAIARGGPRGRRAGRSWTPCTWSPHAPVDVAALGADFLACSPYKFFGPHLGVLVAAPRLLENLRPDKLLPSSDAVPERFELGTLPYELLAGVTAAVDFIADLDPATPPTAAPGCSSRWPRSSSTRTSCCAGCSPGSSRSTASRCTGVRPGARRPSCSRSPATPAARCTRSSPPEASTRRPAASTRSRPPGAPGSATTGRCGPGSRRTPRPTRSTASSRASPHSPEPP